MTVMKKGGLGRGLNALFDDEETPSFSVQQNASAPAAASAEESGSSRRNLPIAALRPGRFQPRKTFYEAEIARLAESIEMYGILQPLLVRPLAGEKDQYEIIAGERRWRAAQHARLHEVPVVVRAMDDETAMEISLVDNLQRDDLDALEEADAYHRLMEEFAHTQEKLANIVGKSRSHIANTLRLRNLPERVKDKVRERNLSAGHARALLAARDPEALMRQVLERGLSVRETERLAGEFGGGGEKAKAKKALAGKDADTIRLERDLSAALRMKIAIEPSVSADGSGKLVVKYEDLDQLEQVIGLLQQR